MEEFLVFDRWGETVFQPGALPFETKGQQIQTEGWDGSFNDQEMNTAVFVYYVKVLYTDGTFGEFKGDVTLIR